jgi:DNA excision repair protein ERCC-4
VVVVAVVVAGTTMAPLIIIQDSREQQPLHFTRYPSEVAGLVTGDYSVRGFESDFAIERKSLDDLLQSITTERHRFMREVDRLRGYDFARLLIIGTEAQVMARAYRSRMEPRAVLASLLGIEARGLPVCWARSPEVAASMVEAWAGYYVRHRAKPFVSPAELKAIVAPLWMDAPRS